MIQGDRFWEFEGSRRICSYVLREPAVVIESSRFSSLTEPWIASVALRLACTTSGTNAAGMLIVQHTHPIASMESTITILAYVDNDACDLMRRNETNGRWLRELILQHLQVGMTEPSCMYPHEDLIGPELGDWSLSKHIRFVVLASHQYRTVSFSRGSKTNLCYVSRSHGTTRTLMGVHTQTQTTAQTIVRKASLQDKKDYTEAVWLVYGW